MKIIAPATTLLLAACFGSFCVHAADNPSSSSGVLSSTESSSLRGSQSEHDAPDATTTSGTPRLLAEVDVDDRDLADDGEEEEEEEESELDADGIERGTTVVNNIGYALKGYDLLKGNPLDAVGLVKVDLGFRGAIFEPVDYVATPDRQYYTPKDVNVVECEGCNLAFSSYQMHSTADYSSALSAKVSVSGRGGIGAFKGSFSASAGYQEANERFSEKHETSTAAEVSCCVYQAELSAFALPPFSENFLEALEALSANPDATVSKFVREFGTHYVKKVTMGSIYGEQTYLSADAVSAMVQKEINIEMAASASGAFASGNVEAELDFSQSKLETFRSSAEKRSVYARGAKPPTDGDVGAWLEASSNNPVPTYIELEAIYDLVADEDAKQVVIGYLASYCESVNPGQCTPNGQGSNIIVAKAIDDAKKNEHSAQSGTKFQPHLMQTYKKKKVNKKDGEFRVSYKTSDSWVFVGLEQIKQLSWKGFKYYEYDILVDDMKSPQVVNTKDEVVSPTLKNNPDYNCPQNKALTEMVHNPYRYKSKGGKKYHWKKKMNGYKFKLDNEFKYKCSSFRGMTVAPESSWKKVKLGKCPRNHVLTGIADNGSSIYCGLIRQPNREGTTTITPVVNDFTRAFEYSTLDTAVMAGIRGNFYSQGNDVDTMFRFIERALPPPFKYVQAEETEDLGRKVDFVCPSGKAMIGMSSAYGEHMRQSFKVQCARIPGHNLVHAGSGLVFKSGSKGTDADWSFGIKGVGENFALECPAGKLMTGVRTQYGRDFKEKDGGWQIMCLTMKKL